MQLIEFKNKQGDILRGVLNKADSNHVAIFLHGFERTAITEKKFRVLSEKLLRGNISSFAFDFTGGGLSDGDFEYTTTQGMTGDLKGALEEAKKYGDKISIVGHSLGACVIANFIKNNPSFVFNKIVLLAPALNQRDLMRFWFVLSQVKMKGQDLEITWGNYKEYFNEEAFLKDCGRQNRMSKAHHISSEYFLENKDVDYSEFFDETENVLHIHGDRDASVPLESLNIEFSNEIIVKGGNHDLERPDMVEQWLKGVADFIK